MTVWHEGRDAAGICVTPVACNGTTDIMPCATCKGCGAMTEDAILSSVELGGMIFANYRITIMARLAIVHDAGMIEHRASEGKREASRMTDATILVCLYVGA